LENTLKSSFLGFAFQAHARIGLPTTWNKLFLTHPIKELPDRKFDKRPLCCLGHFTNQKEFAALKILGVVESKRSKKEKRQALIDSGELDPLKADHNPFDPSNDDKKYIAIIVHDFKKSFWKEFFDSFIGKKFIIIDYSTEYPFLELQKSVTLDTRNTFEVKTDLSVLELKKLLIESECVISDQFYAANIASYLGLASYVFVDANKNAPYIEYFFYSPRIIKMKSNGAFRIALENDLLEVYEIDKVVDFICKDALL